MSEPLINPWRRAALDPEDDGFPRLDQLPLAHQEMARQMMARSMGERGSLTQDDLRRMTPTPLLPEAAEPETYPAFQPPPEPAPRSVAPPTRPYRIEVKKVPYGKGKSAWSIKQVFED